MPPNTVYVGRPSKWGNPFRVSRLLSRDSAFKLFLHLFYGEDDGDPLTNLQKFFVADEHHYPVGDVAELRGKDLVCWCPIIDEHGDRVPCHADVLLEIANDGDAA